MAEISKEELEALASGAASGAAMNLSKQLSPPIATSPAPGRSEDFAQPADWQFEQPPPAMTASPGGDPLYPDMPQHWPRGSTIPGPHGGGGGRPEDLAYERDLVRNLTEPGYPTAPFEGRGVLTPEEWESHKEAYEPLLSPMQEIQKELRQQRQMMDIQREQNEFRRKGSGRRTLEWTQGPDKQREERAVELAELYDKWDKEDGKSKA